MKIGLVSCSKAKKGHICSAREMYSESNTFRLSLEYLEKTCDKIFILSAKHGLLDLEDTIQPYDETLVEKPVAERRKWADEVILKLKEKTDLEKDQFIILAGQKYNEFLLEHIKKFQLPLEGLTMFKRVPKLKEMIKDLGNETRLIHQIVNEMPRFTWDEIDNLAFTNGVYIICEKGESYYDLDRIVRVGTHKADGRLKARLKDHYLRKNKDGSIFRKNIGLALLNKDQDPLNKNEKDEEKKISTKDIEKFIKDIFIESKGSEYVDILSKDIHKAMGLKSRYPMVCGAMYNLQKEIS